MHRIRLHVRILIAPDKFKGSLSAPQASQAISRGLQTVWPDAQIDLAPIADGGEGFAESLAVALGAEWVTAASQDAIGRPIKARYAWLPGEHLAICLLYTSPSPRDGLLSRMPSSA